MNLKQGGKKSTKMGVIPLSGLFVICCSSVPGIAENWKERKEKNKKMKMWCQRLISLLCPNKCCHNCSSWAEEADREGNLQLEG